MLNLRKLRTFAYLAAALQTGCVTKTVLRADKLYRSELESTALPSQVERVEAETCIRYLVYFGSPTNGSLDDSLRELTKREQRSCLKNVIFTERVYFYAVYVQHCYIVSADKEAC